MKENITIHSSHSEQETQEIAKKLAMRISDGTVVCLDGDLGTGKTVFAKGFALGLGITQDITSPTFTIMQTYIGKRKLHHFDVYRICDISELEEIGYEEFFYEKDSICLVEWANLVAEAIPEDAIWIRMNKDLKQGLEYRRIEIQGWIKEDKG